MKSKLKFIIPIISVFAVAGIVLAIVLISKSGSSDAYRVIKVVEATGNVLISRSSAGDITAYSGMALQSGDNIHVDGNSSLILMMDSDKMAYVEQNTTFSLIAEGTAKNSKTVIDLTEGAVTCEIIEKLSDGSSYEVSTPNSTMAVRGTGFRTEVEEPLSSDSNANPSEEFIMNAVGASSLPEGSSAVRITVTDGFVSVSINGLNGSTKDFKAGTDTVIAGTSDNASIVLENTTIDPNTFTIQALKFFEKISENSGKMSVPMQDLYNAIDAQTADEYTVSFYVGSTLFASQKVKAGGQATEPLLKPSENGYWDVTFTEPVNSNLTIKWKEQQNQLQ